jgi:O-acetylhomoserine (thiol)-lyase
MLLQGLEHLHLRIKEHSLNALKIAKFLESHPKIKKVNYPLLKTDISYSYAKKYLQYAGGIVSFEVEDYETAKKIVSNLKIFSLVTNIGDSKSLVTHPASTTHQQLTSDELVAAGVPEGLIRLSIGIEDVDDLISDLKIALNN